MAEPGQKRKLSAVLSADVVGYSRLMQDDDAATVETLTKYRGIFNNFVDRREGRVVDSPGDNILAEFDSPVEAVQCAIELQHEFEHRNRQLADHRKMQFRIGINLGDILSRDDGTIYGDGVNVAARLESLAEPGGIMISESARMQVRSLIDVSIADAGEHEVKNIAEPVHAYRVVLDQSAKTPSSDTASALSRPAMASISAVLVLALVGFAIWSFSPVPAPDTEAVAAADPALVLPTGPSVAVLPFDNLSGDPQQDYFAAGITEELINQLTRFRELRVFARNTTADYKAQNATLSTLYRELGARYVVEGGVQRDRETVRVIVKLMDASDGTNLWGKTYNRDLTAAGLFEIQDEIVTSISATIGGFQGVVLRSALRNIVDKPPESIESIDCRLRLVSYYDNISADAHKAIRECAERAVKDDPDYSGAWYTLAWIYLDEHRFNLNTQPKALERALDAANRAVNINPGDSAAHLILAVVHFSSQNVDSFRSSVDKALSINSNDTLTLALGGQYLIHVGDDERGIAMVRKAVALNPGHPSWYHFPFFHYHFTHGDYETALADLHKTGWDFYWTHVHNASMYGLLERTEDARNSVQKLLELYPGFAENYWEEIGKWNHTEAYMYAHANGLRKAGLKIPDKPTAPEQ